MKAKVVITAHSEVANEKLVDDNIRYIGSLAMNESVNFEDERIQMLHKNNLKRVYAQI
jgi:hypothetical protein